jgi:hypothetical protein
LRRTGKVLDFSVRIGLAVLLSGTLGAAQVLAAEVVAVEVVADVPNSVIVVPQGGSIEFTIRVSATGNLHESITEADPAIARAADEFVVSGGAVAATRYSAPLAFWSSARKHVTWNGSPTPYAITACARVPVGTPPGEYTGPISMLLSSPPGLTPRLDNNAIDTLTIRVVPGDDIPPTSSAAIEGPRGDDGWYLGDVTVSLTAEDNPGGSGVDRIEWSLDGGQTWAVGADVAVSGEGTHILLRRAIDRAGNAEPIQESVIRIDANDPTIAISGVSEGDCAREADISVSAADTAAGSGVRSLAVTLDGLPFAGGVVDTEGRHVLAANAVDSAGRVSTRAVSFTIDRSAPLITITSPQDGMAYRTPPVFVFTTEDENGVARVESSHPAGQVFDTEGESSAWVTAQDAACNVARSQVWFIVDRRAPESEARASGAAGDNGWFRSAVEVTLNANDPADAGIAPSGIDRVEYRLNGGDWVVYEGPFMISAEGEHDLEHRAIDRAGNEEAARSFTVKIDSTAPQATLNLGGDRGQAGWWASLVTMTARGDDALSGFAYAEVSFDGVAWTRADRVFVLDEGQHSVSVRGYDFAGNVSETVTESVWIDRTPPVSACSLSGEEGANGWFTSEVEAVLSSQDAISGVARTEYSFDGETWEQCSGPLIVSDPGITVLHYRSVDAAGNAEGPKVCTVSIDLAEPDILVSGVSDGDWVPLAQIAFDAVDPEPGSGVSSVYATLDGEPFSSGAMVEAEGEHELVVTAVDVAGRIARRSVAFTIDRTAPLITIHEPEDGGAYNRPVTFQFSIFDLDPFVTCESSHEAGAVFEEEGAYRVDVGARDRAGNSAHRSCEFVVDLTAPAVRCELEGPVGRGLWWVGPVRAHLVPEDPLSGGVASGDVRPFWRLGGVGDWHEGSIVDIEEEGVHTLEYFARDRAGNESAVERVRVLVDLADPSISVDAPQPRTYCFGETLAVRYSASDSASGVMRCSATLNGVPVASGEQVRLITPGCNVLVVTAEDEAGRTSTERVEFRVAFKPGKILPPGSLGHVWNAGRTMPVKFTVLDAFGLRTDAARAVVEVWQAGSLLCSGVAQVQEDSIAGPFYQFNAKTLKDRPGELVVVIVLDDGTVMRQTIMLR